MFVACISSLELAGNAAAVPQQPPPLQPNKPAAKAAAKKPAAAGRHRGAQNFNDEDINGTNDRARMFVTFPERSAAMLDIAEEILPLNGAMWQRIADRFAEWAEGHGRPRRDAASLRRKYQKLISGPPTGDGEPSPRQQRARAIEARCADESGAMRFGGQEGGAEDDADDHGDLVMDAIEDAEVLSSERACVGCGLAISLPAGAAKRGKVALAQLTSAVQLDEASSSSARSTPSRPRTSPGADILSVMVMLDKQRAERDDRRREEDLCQREEERRQREEVREEERREREAQQKHELEVLALREAAARREQELRLKELELKLLGARAGVQKD